MTALMLGVTPDLGAAFTTVYVQQQARVRRIAASRVLTGDPGIVEDIVQESFLRLWKYVSEGHQVKNVEGLLSTMTWCAAAGHFRLSRTKRERAADFTDPVTARRMPADSSAEDVAVARETSVWVSEIRRANTTSPAVARQWLTESLASTTVPQGVLDDAVLILSELVTNAAVHAGGRVLMSAELLDAGLRLAVHDGKPFDAQEQPEDEFAEGGRGLLIVRALADVEVDSRPDGTTVIATVPMGGKR